MCLFNPAEPHMFLFLALVHCLLQLIASSKFESFGLQTLFELNKANISRDWWVVTAQAFAHSHRLDGGPAPVPPPVVASPFLLASSNLSDPAVLEARARAIVGPACAYFNDKIIVKRHAYMDKSSAPELPKYWIHSMHRRTLWQNQT